MVFSSAPFLFVFLPVIFIFYILIPGIHGKNFTLMIGSLLFYAYGEPVFVLAMIGSVVVNYFLALAMCRNRDRRKQFLILSLILNIGLIAVFKYAGFLVESLNHITGLGVPVPNIPLPIGISFFTFQIMSYVIDVYRDENMLQKSFYKLLLYISFFPQLIAGPIVKYHDIDQYLDHRDIDTNEIVSGMQRFIWGLSKKLLIANTMGAVADQMFNLAPSEMTAVTGWVGAICYTLQIFFDFSGYSDMAIGMGHMFGFTFQENFNHPYISTSIKEFWRRWHISLSTWFRDYLYIPLGGSRVGKTRTEVNKLIVFFLTGLWHGASWNFVIWGMIHGVSIVIEDIFSIPKKLEKFRFIGWLYTIFIVIVAFVLFRADDFTMGFNMLHAMFAGGFGDFTAIRECADVLDPFNIFMFIVALITCVPLPEYFRTPEGTEQGILRKLGFLLLFFLCVVNVAGASYNPFIYFRF